jgi:enoyl-CoA hydratase
MSTEVTTAIDGTRASITLATDSGINVLSTTVLRQLQAAIDKVAAVKSVRITTLRAEGKVFVAGADIKEMADYTSDNAREYGQLGHEVFHALEDLPCITIAVINGAALGGGFELALACDFRIAVAAAKVGLPETSLGLIPGWGGITRAAKLIGPSAAKKLVFSATPITAQAAHTLGLIDECVSSLDQLDHKIDEWSTKFNRGAPEAIALAKRAFIDGDDITAFAYCFDTPGAREGMTAFLEKRPANWMET